MTATRTYHGPARQARRQHTKQAIIDAFIAQLGDPGRAVLSPAAAARAAGVSIRTVHHYFPDADAQLAAVAAEMEARLFPQPPPLPKAPAELPDLVTAVYHGSEGQLPLLRALVTSSIGPQIRARRRASRLEAIRTALEQIGTGQAETRRAVAIVSLLASADAGVVLADQYGLTLAEAGRASAEATRAIIDSLSAQATRPRAHTTAAGPTLSYGSCRSLWSWRSISVGVPALMGLLGAILVMASAQTGSRPERRIPRAVSDLDRRHSVTNADLRRAARSPDPEAARLAGHMGGQSAAPLVLQPIRPYGVTLERGGSLRSPRSRRLIKGRVNRDA